MEFIRKLLTQTGAHLSGLTRSQRIAIGLCAVIIAGSLWALVQWSAARTYVPLPLSQLSTEEQAEMQVTLENMGVDFRVENNRILVPPQDRSRVLGRLVESQSISGKVTIDFAKLIESDSPWLSENEKQWRRTVALSGELSKAIAGMSGVTSARVFIDNTVRRGFAGRSVAPSAVVSVVPAGEFPLNKKRVHMLASLVAGAVAGLDITKVRVVDESVGRSYTASDPEDAVAADLLEMRRSEEEHYEAKIYERLSYIPGVLVSVFVEQETQLTQTQKTKLDKPMISKTKTETTTDSRGPMATEPGVRPNVGAAVAASGSVEQSETETTEEEFMGERGREVTTIQNTRGVVTKLTASIGVPRSWLVSLYKQLKRTEEEPPDEQALDQIEQTEFPKIVDAVKRIINAQAEDQVAVSDYPDIAPGQALPGGATGVGPAGGVMQADSGAMMSFIKGRGTEIGLIALAAFSLLMMLMIVRKAADPSKLGGEKQTRAEEEELEFPEPTEVPVIPAAAGGEGNILTGHELDQEQLRSAQVAEQVGKMVEDNPELAANLVQRWMRGEG